MIEVGELVWDSLTERLEDTPGRSGARFAAGSELHQPVPGVFLWRTPTGRQYTTSSHRPLTDPNQLTGIPPPAAEGEAGPR